MGQQDYMPKTYEPIVPPKPSVPPKEIVPTPIVYHPPQPTPSPSPLPSDTPPQSGAPASGGGNGMVWCSGPQAPGWNVNLPDGGCSTTKPQSIQLSQLPYTGDNNTDVLFSILFYLAVIAAACIGIYYWKRNLLY